MRRRDHERIVSEQRREIVRLQRANDDLLDKLLHTVDRPWTLAPADLPSASENGHDEDAEDWITDPSQLP